jgi:cytochrome d ubiquinol oxidase subunit II
MKQRDLPAFLASSAALAGMLGGAAFGLYPNVLPSTLDPTYNLTIWNASAQPYGLRVGVVWWGIGMTLATIYFTYLYRSFSGKVTIEEERS